MSGYETAGQDSSVTLIGRWAWGPCGTVSEQDAYAYIGNGSLFQVLDVTDPFNPRIVGELLAPSTVSDIDVSGQYAYAVVGYGLQIIDISEPWTPGLAGSADLSGGSMIVEVSGDYAYVGNEIPGIVHIVDISVPTEPSQVGWFLGPGEFVSGIALVGDTLCIGSYNGYMVDFYDVSDPENPEYLWSYFTGPVWSLFYSMGHLFVGAGWEAEFRILDLSKAWPDIEVGSLDMDIASLPHEIAVADSYTFVTTDDGLWVIDISDVTHPQEASRLGGRNAFEVAVIDDWAYAAANGLWIIDVSSPASPSEASFFPTGHMAEDVDLFGEYAYLADGDAGLWVIDISDPANPKGMGNCPTHGFAVDVSVSGDCAFVVNCPLFPEDTTGLYTIEVSDPANPRQLSHLRGIVHYSTQRVRNSLAVSGDYVFLTQSDTGMSIIDASDSTELHEVGFFPSDGPLRDICVAGSYAYLAEEDFRIVDISDPAHPREVGSLGECYPFGVAVVGSLAYLGASGGLLILTVADPTHPEELGYVPTPGGRSSVDISISGSYAYMAYGLHLVVVDISSPSHPRVVGWAESARMCSGVAADENYIYVASDVFGLYIYQNDLLTGVKGDLDRDGAIDVTDVIRVINIILGLGPEPTAYESWAADYDNDGSINVIDVVLIVNVILG